MFLVFDDGLVCPQITDLLVNITKHILKPKHQVLSEQAKQRLLKKYSIEEKQVSFETKKSYKDVSWNIFLACSLVMCIVS